MMDHKQIVFQISQDIKEYIAHGDSGHDWWHMYRVAQLADQIALQEGANRFVVQLGSWLHDVADWKFHNGDETVGPRLARSIMQKYKLDELIIDQVCDIIETISFKGAGVATPMKTLEGEVVQDADRLDAIGAIGIARTFMYGGFKNNPMHTPDQQPVMHATKEAYKKSSGSVINHFYEKLLLLKDRMNTTTAKKIAESRNNYMQQFLDTFLSEWVGSEFENNIFISLNVDQSRKNV